MSPPASGQSDTGWTLVESLDRAARRLTARLEPFSAMEGEPTREDIQDELEQLLAQLRVTLSEDPSHVPSPSSLRPRLQLQLVTELTDEIVAMALDDGTAPAGGTLTLLGSLRKVRRGLEGERAEDLRARLARPDAFQLLVEVAHDMRSPLTSILFLSETLRCENSGEINDLQRTQLGLIFAAALGRASLTSDIVDLAREERGLADADPEPYAPADVFHGVLDLVRPMAEEKGIELRVKVPEYDRFFGQPAALQRVMLNLSTNALKFTDSGYVELGVKRRNTAHLEFYVRDTGRGILPERQEQLFQPFKKRRQRAGHFFSGSGVGLSIARRLVRALGSELQVETAPDWGTRFYFILKAPRRPPDRPWQPQSQNE
jgi:signal transduction histidine kinase